MSIDPINSPGTHYQRAISAAEKPTPVDRSEIPEGGIVPPKESDVDRVSIGPEAWEKFSAEMSNHKMIRESQQQEKTDGPTWEIGDGLKTGTYTRKGGVVQKVSIEGDKLTIEETKNGKLIRTVNGTIFEGGMSLDTEYYDSAGRLSQSIHTDIAQGEAAAGWTGAVMSRDIKWYEGGDLKGEMQDNMILQTWNSGDSLDEDTAGSVLTLLKRGSEEVNTDTDSLLSAVTVEKQHADYYAQIKEYSSESGKLARELIIEQSGRYKQLSNRQEYKVGNMEARTSQEMEHDSKLHVLIKNYDADGNLMRQADFTDEHKDKKDGVKGEMTQRLSVSWYNDGELVKRSNGHMTFDETATQGLPDRPGFLEMFSMSAEEYLGDEPQSAMELMTAKTVTNASDAEVFTTGLAHHINDRDYNPTAGIAQYGEDARPYSISWTDEVYSDGELVMRRKDTEGARATSFWQRERGLLFRKGAALTENAAPVVLRESSHEREVYEDGELAAHQSSKAKERVEVDHHGPDTVHTLATFKSGLPGGEDTSVFNSAGTIEESDPNANAAAAGFSGELQTTLDSIHDAVRNLNMTEPYNKGLDVRINPVFHPDVPESGDPEEKPDFG